jgi:hypothetical protein
MLAIAITAVSTPPVVAHETMAARANQMASTAESFYRFYGMRHVSATGGGCLARSWAANGRGRVLVRLAYVDVHGNYRDGSAVIARWRMVLFASRSTVSAAPLTVLRRASPWRRRIGPLSTTPWNRVKGESYQV